jgi:arylsulfatase
MKPLFKPSMNSPLGFFSRFYRAGVGQRRITFHVSCLVAALCFTAKAADPARPNIILVMTDDQGYGDLSWTGNPIIKTPRIDAFAKESVRFTAFHVSPTCAPTRCSLMTGRHEFRSGVTHTILERERMS